MNRFQLRRRALLVAAPILLFTACKKTEPARETTAEPARSPAIVVTRVEVGRAINSDKLITAASPIGVRDTIYASVTTDGAAEGAPIFVTWTDPAGTLIEADTVRVSPTATTNHEFHISRARAWTPGKYKVVVQLGDSPARTVEFDVR